jgi:titin
MEEYKMKSPKILTSILILTLVMASLPVQHARSATITVTTKNDVLDAAGNCADITVASLPGPDGVTSLREAICAANNNADADTINFNIPGAGVQNIVPISALPLLVDDSTTLDGYSQFGAAPADDDTPATILIGIKGTGILNNGLNVTSSGNVIRGLAIYGFLLSEISITNYAGRVANDNVIAGNFLGTDASSFLCPGPGNLGWNGVFIGAGAQDNLIGGDSPADRNLISCNGWEGVGIHGSGTTGNIVSGNYIGDVHPGPGSQANILDGVRVYGGAQDNLIGGDTPGERNVISGNDRDGVRIVGETSSGNVVSGNYIGLDATGAIAMLNSDEGVNIIDAPENLVGGDVSGERNVISGNGHFGVYISGATASGNVVSGNYIGVDATGTAALPNINGVSISDASDNLIGGDILGERNVISANEFYGVYIGISDATGNVVSGNYIGVDATGTAALPNGDQGIQILAASNNLIGGDTPGERNVISGNDGNGIDIAAPSTSGNVVSGNYIGVDATGAAALPNNENGVYVHGNPDNLIGGDTPGERNVISGNGKNGVRITGAPGNVVSGNYIGVDATGAAALPNNENGVEVSGSNSLIGGDTPGERNVISANASGGVRITSSGNVVSGNYIGVDASGTADLGNVSHGILLSEGAQDNTIGGETPEEGNLIGFNAGGISLIDSETVSNTITGNYIGTDASGLLDLGNDFHGVQCLGARNVIGPHNAISHNMAYGIYVVGPEAVSNIITQNSIFTNGAKGIKLEGGANNDIAAPLIAAVNPHPLTVAGTTCAGCTVEVFGNSVNDGEGKYYLGSITADGGGAFSLALISLPYPHLTATATYATDGTSEFSTVFTTTVVLVAYLPLVGR